MESSLNFTPLRRRQGKIFLLTVAVIFLVAMGGISIFFKSSFLPQKSDKGEMDRKFAALKKELKDEQDKSIDEKFNGFTELVQKLIQTEQTKYPEPSLIASTQIQSNFEFTTENLIRNSSFELSKSGKPNQWEYLLESTSSNTYQTREGIRSGNYGLKFVGYTNSDPNGAQLGISQSVTKTVPGRTYALSLYVKTTDISESTHLRLGFWNEFTNSYAHLKEIPVSPHQDWTRISTIHTTTGNITDSSNWYPLIEVRNHKSGTLYIEDVQLIEGSTMIAYNSSAAGNQSNDYSTLLGNGSVIVTTSGTLMPAESSMGTLGTDGSRWDELYLSHAVINSNGDMTLGRDLTVGRNATIQGDVTVKGDITLGEDSEDIIIINGPAEFINGITVGEDGEFVVNSSGNVTKINGVSYSYPSTQGSATTVLINDGSGNLSWGTFGAASVTADSLDFAQFVDGMNLDADVSVDFYDGTGSRDFRFYNSDSLAEILYLDGSSGRVGIGTTDTSFALNVNGAVNASSLYLSSAQVTASAAELNFIDGASVAVGGIFFGNGTNLTQDAGNLYWDDTLNRLGIGTTSPSYRLDVNGDVHIAGGSDLYIGSIGLNDTGTSASTSGASLIGVYSNLANSTGPVLTIQQALYDIHEAVGARDFTNSLVLTDNQTVTAALDSLNIAIGSRNFTNTANHILSSDGVSITQALESLNTQVGTRDYTNSLLLTDGATLTDSLERLNIGIGGTAYTSNNYISAGTNIRVAISALDAAFNNYQTGTEPWTDSGNYLYPSSNEFIGNSASGGANKLRGIYLGTTAPLVLGGTNNYDLRVSGTNLVLGDGTNSFLTVGDSGTTAVFAFNIDDLFIRGDGNVAIGTTDAVHGLTVNAQAIAVGDWGSGNAVSGFQFGNTGTEHAGLRFDGSSNLYLEMASLSTDPDTWYDSATPLNFIVRNGEVGIGTTNPSSALTVTGSWPQAFFTDNQDSSAYGVVIGNSGIGTGAYGEIGAHLWNGSVFSSWQNLVLQRGGGDVGIGTTSPTNKLHVYNTTSGEGIMLDGNTNNGYGLATSGTTRGFLAVANSVGAWTQGASVGDIILRSENNDIHINTGGGGAPTATFTAAGSVGIGTTSPTYKLQVNSSSGGAIFGTSTSISTAITGENTTSGGIGIYGYNSSTGYGVFAQSQGGTAIYGQGGTGVSASGSAYGVNASGTNYGVYASASGTGYGIYGTVSGSGTAVYAANNGSGYGLYGYSASGYALYCSATVANKCGGNQAWYNASDRNLKKDITNIENALDKVLNLQGVNYVMKNDPTNTKVMGFIAQDVLPYVPEVVSYDQQNQYYGMQTGQLTALLVEAVKDQQDIINGNISSISSLSLIGSTLNSKIDILAAHLNKLNNTNTDILGLQDTVSSVDQTLQAQKQDLLALQQQMDSVLEIVNKTEKSSTPESDINSLTDRVSFLEQLLGAKTVSASTGEDETTATDVETEILEDLTVTGKANLFDLGVVGDISAGQIAIHGKDAEINSLGIPLEIQSESTAPVEVMGGKVAIDTQGNLEVKGIISAKKYEVEDSEKESASIGEGTLKAGQREVIIETTAVTDSSKIFLTPTRETDLQLAVVEKIHKKSFKVRVTKEIEQDLTFNWWIVN